MVVAVPQGAKLVLATHNQGKLAEFREILAQAIANFDPASVISAADLQIGRASCRERVLRLV